MIDDEPVVRDLLTDRLQPRTVYAFEDGETAWTWFTNHPQNRVALVICDHHLPGMSGIETIRKLRSMDPNRRFILMSGASVKDPERMVKQGLCDAFLVKPPGGLNLTRIVDALLESDREGRSSAAAVRPAHSHGVAAPDWPAAKGNGDGCRDHAVHHQPHDAPG